MNIISKENLKNNSLPILRSLIQSSSEMNGCPITNILEKEIKSIWLSDESLPQEIILNLNKNDFIHYPKKLSTIGIYCWHAYSTNPKLIEILISINKTVKNYISLGDFDLELKPGLQLLHLDEDLLLDSEDNKLNDYVSIKLIIKETFGGKRTYINNLSLYEEVDMSILNLKSIQEENDEEENSSMVFLRESRTKNNYKKKGKKNNNANNGNILLTSEILISDSELSDRKQFGDKVDKFFGLNSKSKIVEISEAKENNSISLKDIDKDNDLFKIKKINIYTNNNNTNNNINNNNKDINRDINNDTDKTKFSRKNKSPLKTNIYNISDKNFLGSDKKIFSNIYFGTTNNNNNNNLNNANINNNINTQTSQNNLNNQLLTTELMKSQIDYLQNDFFSSPEKQNKFLCSKGEISNIEYGGDNILLINEFRSYQRAQDEKMKKFDERITDIENQINDINITIKEMNNNINNLIKNNKINENKKEKENNELKDLILKECEQMIKLTLIDILDKKINPNISTNKKNGDNIPNNLNFTSNKVPESKFNRYEQNFYQTQYKKCKKKKSAVDLSNNKNISIDQNDNYLTHQVPFYPNNNNSNSSNNYNTNNNIIFNHKRNSTFSQNFLNLNKNNLESNYTNINNSQNIKNGNKYNVSLNNYSEFSDSHNKDYKYNTIRTPYYDYKSETNSKSYQYFNPKTHTPISNNNSNYIIPHKNKPYVHNVKGYTLQESNSNYNYKENTLKLVKNKSTISCMTYKGHNTISNQSNHTPKVLTTKRQHSHSNINNKKEIANKINDHLEEKFADFGDKLGKNINDCLLKPSLAKLKKMMKKNLKQVKNSLKKAELSHRSKKE